MTEPREQFEKDSAFVEMNFEKKMVEWVHARSITKYNSPLVRPAIMQAWEELYGRLLQNAA